MFKRVLSASLVAAAVSSQAQMIGPTPYLQASDSPFASMGLSTFYLEDMEDGLVNTPGLSFTTGAVFGPAGNCDSVDGDDGKIDGFGRDGHSYFYSVGQQGITANFDASVLGQLPTHVGVVWTDGSGTVGFEALDASGAVLGVLQGNHADGSSNGTTAEDRFYGAVFASGVKSIRIRNSSGGIEIDHVQYGFGVVPEPGTLSALGLGLSGMFGRRLRQGRSQRQSPIRTKGAQ